MPLKLSYILLFALLPAMRGNSQTALQTSFETGQSYVAGNINSQQGWSLVSGTAVVTASGARTGSQALKVSAAGTSLQLNYVAYASNVPGITGEVYADMWVNPSSFATKGIAINGYDLFAGSSKRIFVIEFGTDNKLKAYNGSSQVNVADWVSGQYIRISIKMDFATEKYKVAINGTVNPTELTFRETYTPTASGTRVAGVKELHSLRFNHTNDTQVATTSATCDDLYVGTSPISGVSFGTAPVSRTVTVTQPAYGSIVLNPAGPTFDQGQSVTATLSLPAGYINNGWTGDLSGTEPVKSFTVNNNMTIGANVVANTSTAVKRTVSTVTEFKAALNAMNPGDTIEVNNGSYNLSSLSITRSGSQSYPIIIKAKNKGQAILNGATALIFKNMKYTTFSGFAFRSSGVGTGIKLENCNYFRITNNSFAITETSSCTWVYIGDTYASPEPLRSGYNRIDHNTFDGKTQAGNYIRMDGNINQQTRYDTIDHNWFKNNGPRAANEKESIRVGVSTLSKSSGFTTIEYNLFTDCDGDPEIVSVKSCDNTIRYNTFVRCLGTLCLRQGFRSTAEGNYFFGDHKTGEFDGGTLGCGGIRVYGKDHKIINNYFHGLTGSKWDAAITITNGDVTNSSTSLADHYLPENILVAFNTLVYNKSNIEIGFNNNGKYPLAPINCQIVNNIVSDTINPLIKSYSTQSLAGVSFSGNIMYPVGTATIGITATSSQIRNINPLLILPSCSSPSNCSQTNAAKVFRLSSTSPAINTSTGSYAGITLDFEKKTRTGVKDVGACEYLSGTTVTTLQGALDSSHAGPNAIPFSYTYSNSAAAAATALKVQPAEISVYPNPVKGQLNIYINKEVAVSSDFRLLNTNGILILKRAGLTKGKNSILLNGVLPGIYVVEYREGGRRVYSSTIMVVE